MGYGIGLHKKKKNAMLGEELIEIELFSNCLGNILETRTKKNHFDKFVNLHFNNLKKCQYVKGICICCSCQLGGPKIAETECRTYGETSLHLFSNQIDYASAQAPTPYGLHVFSFSLAFNFFFAESHTY